MSELGLSYQNVIQSCEKVQLTKQGLTLYETNMLHENLLVLRNILITDKNKIEVEFKSNPTSSECKSKLENINNLGL